MKSVVGSSLARSFWVLSLFNNMTCCFPSKVDGYYKDWSSWEQCSVTCGGGQQTRHRECVEPLYGGEACQGPATQSRDCNQDACPGMYEEVVCKKT